MSCGIVIDIFFNNIEIKKIKFKKKKKKKKKK